MEKLLEVIRQSEDQALDLGDLTTAINLNWLRNAIGSGTELDEAFYRFLNITYVGRLKD